MCIAMCNAFQRVFVVLWYAYLMLIITHNLFYNIPTDLSVIWWWPIEVAWWLSSWSSTVYPKKYAHGFVVLCFVVVMQSFIMNSHEVFIHIHQGCFAGTGAVVRLPQCQWSKPDGYGKISQCITTTKHSKAKTVCIFLGIYCMFQVKTYGWFVLYLYPNTWWCIIKCLLRNKVQWTLNQNTIISIKENEFEIFCL